MLDIECDNDKEDLCGDEFEGYINQEMDEKNEEVMVDAYAHVDEDEAVGEM